jgi:hypothetical protein
MGVITHINLGQLKWAGHLIQKNDQQPAKRIFIGKPEGSRTRRRPCSRWTDNIGMDICHANDDDDAVVGTVHVAGYSAPMACYSILPVTFILDLHTICTNTQYHHTQKDTENIIITMLRIIASGALQYQSNMSQMTTPPFMAHFILA